MSALFLFAAYFLFCQSGQPARVQFARLSAGMQRYEGRMAERANRAMCA